MMPDFWRKELWHPVTVHFPIALLLVATLFFVISIFKGGGSKRTIQNASFMISILGVVGAWISIYTGDMADGIVSRKICDPTILKDHELAAETMTYLFTAAAVVHILLFFNILGSKLQRISPFIILTCMLIGSVFLVRTGHLGASVVYQQGAGVYKHSVDCDDFE
jgi:uncharacterized membrane protein